MTSPAVSSMMTQLLSKAKLCGAAAKLLPRTQPTITSRSYSKHVPPSSVCASSRFVTHKRSPMLLQSHDQSPDLIKPIRRHVSEQAATRGPETLNITSRGRELQLNYFWLRDHCRCPTCYNYDTLQKNIIPPQIPSDIHPVDVSMTKHEVQLTWPDGHKTDYNLDWLAKHYNHVPGPKVPKQLWDGHSIQSAEIPLVPYDELLEGGRTSGQARWRESEALKTLLHSLLKYGFGLVEGAPVSIEGTQSVAEQVSFVMETMFGRMWSFTADLARSDTAYTNLALGAHTDQTYYTYPAGIQVFHMMEHDGEGGQTLLVDGFHAAETLRRDDPHAFSLLQSYSVHHEYRDDGSCDHVQSLAPILRTHPTTGHLEGIRYNHYDRCPIATVPPGELPEYYRALQALSALIEAPSGEHWVKLRPGQVLLVDNWRVLHGRASFTGRRRVAGCYLPRDEWLSTARVVGLVD